MMEPVFLEPQIQQAVQRSADPPALPLAVRRIAAAAEALGFTMHTVEPDHLVAYRVDLRAGVEARWGKTGKNNVFQWATIRDPIGFPTELYHDYSPSANDLKQQKDEPYPAFKQRSSRVQETALRRDREYNDGASHLLRQITIKSTTPLHAWLNDWMDTLNVDAKRLPIPAPRKKATKEEKVEEVNAAMIAGEEWVA